MVKHYLLFFFCVFYKKYDEYNADAMYHTKLHFNATVTVMFWVVLHIQTKEVTFY